MRKNNRKKILEVARGQFLKYGYNQTSIRSIAKIAGLTSGAIYFHFQNKKEIYETICLESIDILIQIVEDLEKKAKTPGKKLITAFDAYYLFYSKYRPHYKIFKEYQSGYLENNPVYTDKVIKRFEKFLDIMLGAIKEGIKNGIYRDMDPKRIVFYLTCASDGMLQFKDMGLSDHLGIDQQNFRRFMINITESGILKGSSTSPN